MLPMCYTDIPPQQPKQVFFQRTENPPNHHQEHVKAGAENKPLQMLLHDESSNLFCSATEAENHTALSFTPRVRYRQRLYF